jgi:hypothetical protein
MKKPSNVPVEELNITFNLDKNAETFKMFHSGRTEH